MIKRLHGYIMDATTSKLNTTTSRVVDATWQRERCPSSQNPTTVLTALKTRQKGPKKRYLDHPDIVLPGYHAIVVDMVPEKIFL
jgi:hypothetical protein